MSRDPATPAMDDVEEHHAPAGTWASEPGDGDPLADELAGEGALRASPAPRDPAVRGPANGAASSAEDPPQARANGGAAVDGARAHRERPSPTPTRREPTGRTRLAEATDSHVRPRFLASELLRRRSESHEPIWPSAARGLGVVAGVVVAALALGFAATGPLGVAVGVAGALLAVAAAIPMSSLARTLSLGALGGTTVVLGALLSGRGPEVFVGAAALAATAGAFLRARRFGSRSARALFVVAGALGLAALALDGGAHVLSIESFALADVAPAVRQLALVAGLLLPLVTLLDGYGPSGALAVAAAWIVERVVDGAFHVALEGPTPGALGPLLGAIVLPSAALALAQALAGAGRGTRSEDG